MKRILLFLFLIISLKAIGATYYVATTGNNSNPGTYAQPFLTIQKGADEAEAGDTVIVKDGTYTTAGSYFLVISTSGTSGSPIVFMAENKGGVILDGQNVSLYGITLYEGVDYINIINFEIKNFLYSGFHINDDATTSYITIRGCNVHHIGRYCDSSSNGHNGITMRNASNFTIENCIIHDIGRYALGENGCTPTNEYYKNHDHGIYISSGSSNITIRNNIFYNCNRGWALHLYPDPISNLNVYNNTFAYGNMYAILGSHIIFGANLTNVNIKNNIFTNQYDYAIYNYYGTFTNVVISYNICYGGDGAVIDTPEAGITVSNNITATDPLLTDPANRDFTLFSESPCIDAAIDVGITTDYLDSLRDASPDIGAYEYFPDDPPVNPTVITVTSLYPNIIYALVTSTVTDDGGGTVSARGVCWSTSANPTTSDSKTINGTGAGSFNSTLTPLLPSTTYHARAYATNEAGTSYSADEEFTTLSETDLLIVTSGGKVVSRNGKIVNNR